MFNEENSFFIKQKFLEATKNILEKNLNILDEPFIKNKIVFVYDLNSNLSTILSESYISNLKEYENLDIEIINFDDINKDKLKENLLSLKENSTVILVQSTNFRLEDFRIRLSLHKNNVWCLEHNHLVYIKDYEIKNYLSSLEYKTPYYDELSEKLKNISDWANKLKVVSKNWNILEIEGWFEDMKQNTWNYKWKNRWWTLPFWENFSESKDFSKVNWKLSIRAYPWLDLSVNFVECFDIIIKESLVIWYSENTPKEFIEILEMIKKSEDNEVYLRELWFWLNPWISWDKTLTDVNAFERMAWFHVSLWKKHGIYRKKFHRKITGRYHIDIFPDVDYIKFDENIIFEKWNYIL